MTFSDPFLDPAPAVDFWNEPTSNLRTPADTAAEAHAELRARVRSIGQCLRCGMVKRNVVHTAQECDAMLDLRDEVTAERYDEWWS